ncbi:MAG: TIGR04086 family membrane protein [Faecalibacterium sp.]|nr:TIGR04086 family membrane protein [Faecalibacterium sp.]
MSVKRKAFTGTAAILRPLCISVFAGAAICGITLCAFAYLLVHQQLSQTLLAPFSTAALCLGSFAASWLLARQRGTGGLACGLIGFAVSALGLCVWILYHDGSLTDSLTILRMALLVLVNCSGGYWGMLYAEKHIRRRG